MKSCDDIRARLDDLLDGRLNAASQVVVEAHLASCTSCRREFEELRSLRRRTRELPRSLEPPRDLWPGIAGRIASGTVVSGSFGRRGRRWVAAAAALLLMAVGAGGYLLGRFDRRSAGRDESPYSTASAVRQVRLDMPAAAATEEFARARAELVVALEARRDGLSEESLRVVEENLEIIDGAIARITRALQEDPDNAQLTRQLVMAYRQELSLLQRATQLPTTT